MDRSNLTPYLDHAPRISDGDLVVINKKYLDEVFLDDVNNTLETQQQEIDTLDERLTNHINDESDITLGAKLNPFIPFKVKKILYTNRVDRTDFSDLSISTNEYIVLGNQNTSSQNGLYKQTGSNTAIKLTTLPVIGGSILNILFFEGSDKNFIYVFGDGAYYSPGFAPRKVVIDFDFSITTNSELSIINIPFYIGDVTHCFLTISGQAMIDSVLYSQSFITKMTIRNSTPSNSPHIIEYGNLNLVSCSYGSDLTLKVQSSSNTQEITWRILGEIYFDF